MQNIWNALDSWLFNGKDARCPRMRLWAKPSVQRLVAPCLQVGRMINRSLIDALPDVRLTTKRQIVRRSLVEFPQCYIRRNKFVNCRLEIHQIKLIFLNLSCDFGAVKASHSFSFDFVFIWMRAKGRRRRTYYPNFWQFENVLARRVGPAHSRAIKKVRTLSRPTSVAVRQPIVHLEPGTRWLVSFTRI